MNDDWEKIHPDFAKNHYHQTWRNCALTYQDAQEWIKIGLKPDDYLEVKKWEEDNATPQEAKLWLDIGLDRKETKIAIYLRWKGHQPSKDLNLKQLREEFYTAQNYLDYAYPLEKRSIIKGLDISNKNLTGTLDLTDFINLEDLICNNNKLTALKLDNCLKLKDIECTNNNLSEQDLSQFSHFVNLERLEIGNDNQEKINQGIYNRFVGSLEPLKELSKLESLDINNTDIDRGLEYLPNSIENFSCFTDERPNAKCRKIYNLFANKQGIVKTREWYKKKIITDSSLSWKLEKYKKKFQEARNLLKDEITAKDQRISELEVETSTHLEALEVAKKWKERQIKEITEQKDNEITKLKNQLVQLQLQKQQLEAKIEVKSFFK